MPNLEESEPPTKAKTGALIFTDTDWNKKYFYKDPSKPKDKGKNIFRIWCKSG